MAYSAGDLQVAFGEESTWGTAVTPTKVVEVTSESVKQTIDRIESKGLRTQRMLLSKTNWSSGQIDVSGDIEFEVQSRGAGLLFKHMIGCATPTATTPSGGTSSKKWSLAMSPTDTTDGKSLTFEVGRTDITGTRHKFTYAGAKINQWELMCKAGETVNGKINVDAKSETAAASSPTTLTYPTGTPLVFVGAAISVGGSTVSVKEFDIKGDNGLNTSRYMLGSANKLEQLQTSLRSVTGSLTVEWSGLTAYQRFVNGTHASLSAVFATVADIESGVKGSVTITCPDVRFDGDTPTGGGQIVEHPLNFVVVDDESSGTAPLTIDYVTLDTSL